MLAEFLLRIGKVNRTSVFIPTSIITFICITYMVNIVYYPDVNEIEGLAPDLTVILANNSSGTLLAVRYI